MDIKKEPVEPEDEQELHQDSPEELLQDNIVIEESDLQLGKDNMGTWPLITVTVLLLVLGMDRREHRALMTLQGVLV